MRVPPKNLFVEFNRTLKTDKPIIAAVNGHAFAGGFRIAQMADLVVSADHATYAIIRAEGRTWGAVGIAAGLDRRAAGSRSNC